MKNEPNIKVNPSTRRVVKGWQVVLEFPNGGRQAFGSLYWTQDDAFKAAKKSANLRELHPGSCVKDPAPNCLVEF